MTLNIDKHKPYASAILRISMSLVFLWFGLSQIFNSADFLGYLPSFALNLPIQAKTLVILNGIFEAVFGLLLLFGLFTRISSIVLALNLTGIMFSLGYNEIAVRDFGLVMATFVVFINGKDTLCLDNKLRKKRK
jgi:uncharacterized membrane protein YphA (DoxX/SURF4 family)